MDESKDTRSEAIVNGEATPQREASLLARLAAEARKEAGIGDDATPLAMAERFAPLPEDWPVETANGSARLDAYAAPPAVSRGSALTPTHQPKVHPSLHPPLMAICWRLFRRVSVWETLCTALVAFCFE